MTENRKRYVPGFPEALASDSGRYDDIDEGLRVHSADYGDGTVAMVLSIGVQVHWDRPLIGTKDEHLLLHDISYIARLERL